MNKPNDTRQWAWDKALDLVENEIDADWSWDSQAVGKRERQQATEAIARALMAAKAEQRETDAQLTERLHSDEVGIPLHLVFGSIARRIRKGGG